MWAITGITGKVGGAVVHTLLEAGERVRAVVRDPAKAAGWAARGCEIVRADMHDAAALQQAFSGVDGVFVLLPPNFDPSPGWPESRRLITALRAALDAARPPKVVALSTIGAQASQPNLLTQLQLLEQSLATLPMPVSLLRAAWFIDNVAGDLATARASGVMPSFLQPLDKPVPMVAAADVGRAAAALLREDHADSRVIELEGPARVTPLELAAALARALGREVHAEAVPRASWEALFRAQGMQHPLPRMQMLDGFNQGWIDFQFGEAERRRGRLTLDDVLRTLIEPGG